MKPPCNNGSILYNPDTIHTVNTITVYGFENQTRMDTIEAKLDEISKKLDKIEWRLVPTIKECE